MAADYKLKAGTPQVLEASGGSVSNNDWGTANDADLDNTTELAPTYDFELNVGFGSGVTALNPIQLVLVPKMNGTNAADIDTANDNFQYDNFAGSFVTASGSTAARRLTIQGVELGPYKYTAYIFNQSGQTISSTWSLTAYPTINQSV